MNTITTVDDLQKAFSEKYSVIKIGSSCCAPCMIMHDTLVSIESKFSDCGFYEIDTEECDDAVIDDFDIVNIPVTFIMRRGDVAQRINGVRPVSSMVDIINSTIE